MTKIARLGLTVGALSLALSLAACDSRRLAIVAAKPGRRSRLARSAVDTLIARRAAARSSHLKRRAAHELYGRHCWTAECRQIDAVQQAHRQTSGARRPCARSDA